jgi:hypothetical protein
MRLTAKYFFNFNPTWHIFLIVLEGFMTWHVIPMFAFLIVHVDRDLARVFFLKLSKPLFMSTFDVFFMFTLGSYLFNLNLTGVLFLVLFDRFMAFNLFRMAAGVRFVFQSSTKVFFFIRFH